MPVNGRKRKKTKALKHRRRRSPGPVRRKRDNYEVELLQASSEISGVFGHLLHLRGMIDHMMSQLRNIGARLSAAVLATKKENL